MNMMYSLFIHYTTQKVVFAKSSQCYSILKAMLFSSFFNFVFEFFDSSFHDNYNFTPFAVYILTYVYTIRSEGKKLVCLGQCTVCSIAQCMPNICRSIEKCFDVSVGLFSLSLSLVVLDKLSTNYF